MVFTVVSRASLASSVQQDPRLVALSFTPCLLSKQSTSFHTLRNPPNTPSKPWLQKVLVWNWTPQWAWGGKPWSDEAVGGFFMFLPWKFAVRWVTPLGTEPMNCRMLLIRISDSKTFACGHMVSFSYLSQFLQPGNKVLGLIPRSFPWASLHALPPPVGLSGGNSQCLVGQSPENGDAAALGRIDIFQVSHLLMSLFNGRRTSRRPFVSLLSRKW